MTRTKGSENKQTNERPPTCELNTEQRLQLIANLIIDRIAYDQQNNQDLEKIPEQEMKCITN